MLAARTAVRMSQQETFIWFSVSILYYVYTYIHMCICVYDTKAYVMLVGLHLPDPNPHLLTCSAEPFNKTRIIAWHYFNHIPSVEYLADDKHAPGSLSLSLSLLLPFITSPLSLSPLSLVTSPHVRRLSC